MSVDTHREIWHYSLFLKINLRRENEVNIKVFNRLIGSMKHKHTHTHTHIQLWNHRLYLLKIACYKKNMLKFSKYSNHNSFHFEAWKFQTSLNGLLLILVRKEFISLSSCVLFSGFKTKLERVYKLKDDSAATLIQKLYCLINNFIL